MKEYFDRLFPLNRSLTGDGVAETYKILQEIAPFKIIKVKTGTKVFDWTVPPVWNVTEAYIEFKGKKILDFKDNNLHLVGYSIPVDEIISLEDLQFHLHSLKDQPDLIPYVTSYYERDWGFCMPFRQRKGLKRGKYHVVIKSTLKKGYMLLGEAYLKGKSKDEYLISTYSCHPSMANDNVSGMLTWISLLKYMKTRKWNRSYRFLIGPETIGALCHLKRIYTDNVKGALVITTTAGSGVHGFKQTFERDNLLDRVLEIVVNTNVSRFDIRGSDERQYSSAHFRIPTATIYKGKYYDYPEYHTSGDRKLDWTGLSDTLDMYKRTIRIIDGAKYYKAIYKGEPKFSKRNLYSLPNIEDILWVLFYSDGRNDLSAISDKTFLNIEEVISATQILLDNKLIK